MSDVITAKERDLMEHALGRDYPHKERDYRNYYNTGLDTYEDDDVRAWNRLVRLGFAEGWTAGGLLYYRVTDAGRAALDARP
jgi:hypothetical protein